MSQVQSVLEPVADPLSFSASDVTGRRTLEVEGVDGHRSAAEVAGSLATMFDLPTNQPYSLRDSERGRMLAPEEALGSQVRQTGTKLVVIPQSHLG